MLTAGSQTSAKQPNGPAASPSHSRLGAHAWRGPTPRRVTRLGSRAQKHRIRHFTLAMVLLVALVAGCTSSPELGSGSTTPVPRTGQPGSNATSPGSRATPWPQRPVVHLAFDVADDLATVSGRETVRFTPDLRACSLVFRAWPNKPTTAEAGNALVVTSVTVAGRSARPRVVGAGAPPGAPGTLVEVPLSSCVAAGQAITADLRFRLTLGEDTHERVGFSPESEMAWFATAFPLLAWERGRGWARDPAVDLPGEMATSEDFRLASLQVTAPSRYRVLGTGSDAGSRAGRAPGTTVHRFTAEAVRDVAISVGRLDVVEREVDGVRLRVGGPQTELELSLDEWAEQLTTLWRHMTALLGPFPYPDLWITIVPVQSSGLEFPGALQFGDLEAEDADSLVAHELAHMWFYGLVGSNQGRDPWLDESFATFAEAVATGHEDEHSLDDVPEEVAGRTGESMTFWADYGYRTFVQGVYSQGAAALLEARRRVGTELFDRMLRAYIDANAHQIVTPHQVEQGFAGLPQVVSLLREVGAL
jgi:hypothetical protein